MRIRGIYAALLISALALMPITALTDSGELLWSADLDSRPLSTCLLANGGYIGLGHEGGVNMYRRTDGAAPRWTYAAADDGAAFHLACEPSDVYMYGLEVGSSGSAVLRWSTSGEEPLWRVPLPDDLDPTGPRGLAVDPMGGLAAILAADADDNAVLLLVDSQGNISRYEPDDLKSPAAVSVSSGGGRAAIRGSRVELVDLNVMAPLGSVDVDPEGSLSMSGDGSCLLFGAGDGLTLYCYSAGSLDEVWEMPLGQASSRVGLTALSRDGSYGAAAMYDTDDPFDISLLFVRDQEPPLVQQYDLQAGSGRLEDGIEGMASDVDVVTALLATKGFSGDQSDHELLALERGEDGPVYSYDAIGSCLDVDVSPGGVYAAAIGAEGHVDDPAGKGWLAVFKLSEPPTPPDDDDHGEDDDHGRDDDYSEDDEDIWEYCDCYCYLDCIDTCAGCQCSGDDDDDDIIVDDDDDSDDDSDDDDTGDDDDDGCCGCSMVGPPASGAAPWILLCLSFLWFRRSALGRRSRPRR